LNELGAETIEFDAPEVEFQGFSSLLAGDMKRDLAYYLTTYAAKDVQVKSVQDVVNYNLEDSTVRIPYGHARFAGILDEDISDEELAELSKRLDEAGKSFFEAPMKEHQLDAVLSINNRGAGYAAAAKYPCLTVPMGYNDEGRPMGLTFIARPFEEDKLLRIGYAFEQGTEARIAPELFE
jgi:amidase